ncbi:hypothetical protein PVAP13_6KG139906 [Panicum virgatum]|uniref:Uncharacterized protein n=1 Tax=Panicum virgatum TaxID=38727 RepID=A0A8T0RBQ5_PANVG|nr:hypothetical protein PVAP13_6KG139906 [Panicum virgatum]
MVMPLSVIFPCRIEESAGGRTARGPAADPAACRPQHHELLSAPAAGAAAAGSGEESRAQPPSPAREARPEAATGYGGAALAIPAPNRSARGKPQRTGRCQIHDHQRWIFNRQRIGIASRRPHGSRVGFHRRASAVRQWRGRGEEGARALGQGGGAARVALGRRGGR